MANLRSSKKRVRSQAKRTEVNKAQRSRLRTEMKKAQQAIADGDDNAAEQVKKTVAFLDRAAVKGLISKNKAARHKSQLAKALQA